MTAYYNENDPKAAAWLRELIKAGAIAPGKVDERDIRDVRPSELDGFSQCHFFAGIGVWSYALRLAGWSDSEPVWTGSCPCQPFSQAGKGGGFDDERHLWPAWFHLLEECRPSVIFGEQVASKDGLGWLDLVQTDLEATNYAFAPIDLCAAGVGAPHLRQRLYWVADSGSERLQGEQLHLLAGQSLEALLEAGRSGKAGGVAHADGRDACAKGLQRSGEQRQQPQDSGSSELGNPYDARSQRWRLHRNSPGECLIGPTGLVGGFWADTEWLYCTDEKYRPVEPGSFPLAHGAPARMGRLRGYGNAIVAEQAAAFISAYLESGPTSKGD